MEPNRDVILKFLSDLPIRKIPSIGGMKETTLKEIGIETGKDLLEKASDVLIAYNNLPKTHEFLIKCALGIGQELHEEHR